MSRAMRTKGSEAYGRRGETASGRCGDDAPDRWGEELGAPTTSARLTLSKSAFYGSSSDPLQFLCHSPTIQARSIYAGPRNATNTRDGTAASSCSAAAAKFADSSGADAGTQKYRSTGTANQSCP